MRRMLVVAAACALALAGWVPGMAFQLSSLGTPTKLHPRGPHHQQQRQKQPHQRRARASTATTMQFSASIVQSSPEFSQLKQAQVLSAATGKALSLGDTFNPGVGGSKKTIVAFGTHAGDFNTFEFGQKLLHYLPKIEKAGVNLAYVVIGTPANVQEFARLTGFPLDKLYCDPEAKAYRTFGFSRGFLPDLKVNPYLKLLPMLAGIGSPGTIQAVLRGYVGDKDADASWTSSYLRSGRERTLVDKSAFDVLGTEGARPFEVATVRLQNMIDIIPNWKQLAPPNKDLITQQGGCLVFEGRKLVKMYKDKGILTYTDVDNLLETVGVAK